MKVAILCEFSGIVRDAFLAKGHDAISCDLEPTERPGPHIQGDCRDYDWSGYDLIIAHPPCTYLATSGNRWMKNNPERMNKRLDAIMFVVWCMMLPVKKLCIENPVSVIASYIRPCDQSIQPWQFGHPEKKRICLWLENLPKLKSTKIMKEKKSRIHHMGSNVKNRGKERSRFYPGIAKAMAEQWENNQGEYN